MPKLVNLAFNPANLRAITKCIFVLSQTKKTLLFKIKFLHHQCLCFSNQDIFSLLFACFTNMRLHFSLVNLGLIYLNLGENEIEYLTKDSFMGLTSLRSLDLSSNPIKQISDDAFFWLKSLEDLDLSDTDLTTLNIFFR